MFLSSHAWWATALVFGVGAMIWSLPMFLVGTVKNPWAIALVSLGSLILGFGAPLLWMTTRYRITATELKVYSGPFHSTLDLRRIKEVSKTRKGLGLSFAFDTDFLWVGYPRKLGGVLISPKERKLFLLALAAGCPHLELKGGELVASGVLDPRVGPDGANVNNGGRGYRAAGQLPQSLVILVCAVVGSSLIAFPILTANAAFFTQYLTPISND